MVNFFQWIGLLSGLGLVALGVDPGIKKIGGGVSQLRYFDRRRTVRWKQVALL